MMRIKYVAIISCEMCPATFAVETNNLDSIKPAELRSKAIDAGWECNLNGNSAPGRVDLCPKCCEIEDEMTEVERAS